MTSITRTERLLLLPLDSNQADEAFKVYSDARIWAHRPQARHESARQTKTMIEHAQECWHKHGLGPWAIYLRDQPAEFIGVGGVEMVENQVWDLKYRLRPEKWGYGYATEVSETALKTTARSHPHIPVSARVTVNHPASFHVLEKLGLDPQWEGRRINTEDDPEEPDVRIYADRPLDDSVLDLLKARP
ncbi:GNAT family N-acetyltransferase [Corynebacterium poyangense]|uniref:GNAT family N-acetyltransferase n=1 Tax=Corynebacterium poyangense TaxID=2684405 RepID=A0A7H0SNQ5_9CORY|nr:GNAT family N-acetyltransferase [Corynebacterium poyangense]MBZ8177726.1 GNAT family N-acetyltransferase [Corynebacterium poyangense]QNQ90180.1 GNAT family N-acetyltransferase [Corynebacterium poyangense]